MEDKFFTLCFGILVVYLILFLFAKFIFALFGGGKKEKKKKKSKPPKTPFSDKKEVQQDLISLEQLAEEEKREVVDNFVFLQEDLPETMRFNPETFNIKAEAPIFETDSSINRYLDETRDNSRKDMLRKRREEFLKEMNNPLSRYEKPKIDNSQDDLSSMILNKGNSDFIQGDPRSYEKYRQERMNVARENLRRMREMEGESFSRKAPVPRNKKWDYDEVGSLLDDMEAKRDRNELTLKEEFNNLSRDMKIFVLAKMINSDFKS